MLRSRNVERRLNKIHQRALELVNESSHALIFEELQQKFSCQKMKYPLNHTTFEMILYYNEKCDNMVYYRSESLFSLASRIWELLPNLWMDNHQIVQVDFVKNMSTWYRIHLRRSLSSFVFFLHKPQ